MCETSAGGGLASTFPQAPDLDQDLGSVGILLENFGRLEETQQSDVNGGYHLVSMVSGGLANMAKFYVPAAQGTTVAS